MTTNDSDPVAVLARARPENLNPQFHSDEAGGHAFGTEVGVAGEAPLYDRLAGFSSRDPR